MALRAASFRQVLGTLVPAAVLFLAATSPATASCGDYVHILPPGQPGSGVTADPSPGEKPPVPPCPCANGSCRQAPAAPVAPPKAPTPSGGTAHDAVLSAAGGTDSFARCWAWIDTPAVPLHVSTSIFHPPRA